MTWLFVAFAIVWAAFFIYIIGIQRKLAEMSEALKDLKR